jgi:hypothetical protein
MRCAQVLRQICFLDLGAEPPRNPRIRRRRPIRKRCWQYCVLLWIRRLKVRILPPQPPPSVLDPSHLRKQQGTHAAGDGSADEWLRVLRRVQGRPHGTYE